MSRSEEPAASAGPDGPAWPVWPVWHENISSFRFVAFAAVYSEPRLELAAVLFDEEFEQRRFSVNDEVGTSLERFREFLSSAGAPRLLICEGQSSVDALTEATLAAIPKGVRKSKLAQALSAGEGREIIVDLERLRSGLEKTPEELGETLDSDPAVSRAPSPEAESPLASSNALSSSIAVSKNFLTILGPIADSVVSRGQGLTLEGIVDVAGGWFVYNPTDRSAIRKPFRAPPKLAALEPLCGSEARVLMAYERESDRRQVTPIRLRSRAGRVYLEAYCHRDGVTRSFRADKILMLRREES